MGQVHAPGGDASGPEVLVRAGSPRVVGRHDREDHRRARARALAAVDVARAALARCHRGADVRLTVDLEVAASGALAVIDVDTRDAVDVRGEACVRAALREAAPGAPPPRAAVVVALPLSLFRPRPRAAAAGDAGGPVGLEEGADRRAGAPR